jgi:hypothetical protein
MKRCSLLAALVATMLFAGCGADEVAPPEGLPDHGFANIKTDNSAARSATINESGGVITATGSDGAVYTLTVPAGVLDSGVTIRMYPIESITGYPLASGVRAGVHLEPEGFAPSQPLTLTVDLPSSADPATIATLASRGNATDHQLYPAIIDGRRITFSLTHFSQYTIGDATLDALLALRPGQGATSEQFQNDLALKYITARRSGGLPPAAEYATLLNNWYNQVLVPLLTRLAAEPDWQTANGLLVVDLVPEYNAWLSAIDFCMSTGDGSPDVAAAMSDARQRVTTGILNTIITINAHVVSLAGSDPNGPSDAAVVDMALTAGYSLVAQWLASVWDLDTPTNGLDLESVLNSLPIKVAITSKSLPASFAPASVGNLEVRAGMRILDRAVRTSPAVTVRLSNVQGGTVNPAVGRTNAQGVFQSTAQWTSGTTYSVDIVAALESPGLHPLARVRVFDRLSRQQSVGFFNGQWRKEDHRWVDQSGAETTKGIFVQTLGPGSIQANSLLPQLETMFKLPVTWDDNRFSGKGIVGGAGAITPTFLGWEVTVSGELMPDSSLTFSWLATHGTTNSFHGEDVIPLAR